MSIQQLFFSTGAGADKIVATGGTIITNGNYKVHVFTSTGTFSVSAINDSNASLDVFLVNGGYNGVVGDTATSDYDGKNGGDGGQGGNYRTYSSLAFGTYFNISNFNVVVAAAGSTGSQCNTGGVPFTASGGSTGSVGGPYGPGSIWDSGSQTCSANGQSGGVGINGTSNNWTGTTYYYGSGGGGGGGGGAGDVNSCDPGDGGVGGNGAGDGNSGGGYNSNGNPGLPAPTTSTHLYSRGNGGGGGGGAGGNNESGITKTGGGGGAGSAGIVIIRYQFQ